uniref:Uncharacterized protein n=1 Tax=Arundo donax TaxID=35708 RepID=A0A0A9EQ91_ARUDO
MPLPPRTSEDKGRGADRGLVAGTGLICGCARSPTWTTCPRTTTTRPTSTASGAPPPLRPPRRPRPRDEKLAVMRFVLVGPDIASAPILLHTQRRQQGNREMILSWYQPLYRELYTMDPSAFFVPSFLQAVSSNTEDGFRSIMAEPAPGLYVFAMLQPTFCQMLVAEVDHFLHGAYVRNQNIMVTPIKDQDKYGADLSNFGLKTILDDLLRGFVSPIATVLYPELGASSLDLQNSYVIEYAKDQGEAFHFDNSDIRMNVCIGREFTGGEMYFHVFIVSHMLILKHKMRHSLCYT